MSDAEGGVCTRLLGISTEAPRSGSECLGGRTRLDAAGVPRCARAKSWRSRWWAVVSRCARLPTDVWAEWPRPPRCVCTVFKLGVILLMTCVK